MLNINQVKYEYQDDWFEFELTVNRGEIVALMGPSGAGKSTLLSLIAGFIAPVSGDISVDDASIISLTPYQRPFSMLFQEYNLFEHLTVWQNIGLGLKPSLKLNHSDEQLVRAAAQQVGIEQLLERLPGELSGGQKQRVALARCFVQPNPIWLLDEPFSALDPILRAEMLSLVEKLARERDITVIMVTHHLSDARAIADKFAFVANNQVTQTGVIAQLTNTHQDPNLAAFIAAGE